MTACWRAGLTGFVLVLVSQAVLAGFSPAEVDGCHVWFDAGSLSAGATNGAPVSNWVDSVTGYAAIQTNALAMPTFATNAIKWYPAVQFNGSNTLFTGTVTNGFPTNEATVYVVMKTDSTNQSNTVFSLMPSQNTNRFLAHLPYAMKSTFDFGNFTGDGRIQAPTYTGGTNYNVWAMQSELGVGQWIGRNGVREASDQTASFFSIAGRYLQLGTGVQGQIAELIIYNRALNSREENDVGYYLQQKYGIGTGYVDPASLDLALAGDVSDHVAVSGEEISYTLTVVNNGPADASGVVVTMVPTHVTYVSHSGGDFSTNTAEWTIGNLAYQAGTTLTINVTVDALPVGTMVTNSAVITAVNETDNDVGNDSGTAVFSVWHDPIDSGDFTHSMTFTFAGYDRDETLVDFPALIKLDAGMRQFSYADLASAAGNDLRFTDGSGTKLLLHEIDHWDTNGISHVWVRLLKLTSNATVTAYWGNPSLAALPATWSTNGAVWASDYDLVWHLEEGGMDQRLDSSGNAYHSTAVSNQPPAVAGIVGMGNSFDGTAGYVERQFTAGLDAAPFTFSAWARSCDAASNAGVMGMLNNPGNGTHGVRLEEGAGNNWAFRYGEAPGTGQPYRNPGRVRFGEWDHVLVTYDGATLRSYANGELGDAYALSSLVANTNSPLYVGSTGHERYFDGVVDELRFHSVVRSPNWAWAAFRNVAHYEEFVLAETAIRADAASDVTMTSATLHGTLLNNEGRGTGVNVCWGTSDGGVDTGAWDFNASLDVLTEPGSVSHGVTGLQPNTTYYYRFWTLNPYGRVWSPEAGSVRTLFTSNTNGLALWYTAASLGNLADGARVTQWADSSGNGCDLSTYVGAPTYRAGGPGGQPVVRFDGASGLSHNYGGGGFAGKPALTVFIVAKANDTAIRRALQVGQQAGANGQDIGFALDGSFRYNNGNRMFDLDLSGEFAVGMWTRPLNGFYGDAQFYRNGIRGSQTGATSPGNSLNVLNQRVTVGCGVSNTGGRNDYVDGDIAEIIAYDRLLTVEEMDAIGAYLAEEYGLDTTYGSDVAFNKADFTHSVTISFPGYDRAETLQDFPALVVLSEEIGGFSYDSFASPAGEDLRFADSDGTTPLHFEIEEWENSARPLAYYAFESNTLDSSVMSNAFDGVLRNGATYSTHSPGSGISISLDGTDDDVLMSGFQGVTGLGARTMCAWIKTTTMNGPIIAFGPNQAGEKWVFRTQSSNGSNGTLRVEVNGGYVVGSTYIVDDAWHHVAAVFPDEGDNVLDVMLYVDGMRETYSATLGQAINTGTGYDFRVGSDPNNRHFAGLIDDVAIWDAALNGEQLAWIYNGGVPHDLSAGLKGGESAVWVRIPELSAGKEIFAYWGNPSMVGDSSFARDSGATWSEAYEMVWHMQAADAPDATRHGRHGTASTNTLTQVSGIAGDAQTFDTTGYVNYTTDGNVTYPTFMASTWSAASNVNLSIYRSTLNTGNSGSDFQIDSDGAGEYRLLGDHGNGLFGAQSTGWVYLAAVYESGSFDLYYNGEYVRSVAAADNTVNRIDVGSNRARDKLFNGVIDEFRLRNDAPSDNWIWAVYQNVADQANFVAARGRPEGMILLVR